MTIEKWTDLQLAEAILGDGRGSDGARELARRVQVRIRSLHSLRVEFAEWQMREFPLFGFDAIQQMGMRGLCNQAEADAAIEEAAAKVEAEADVAAATESLGEQGPRLTLADLKKRTGN